MIKEGRNRLRWRYWAEFVYRRYDLARSWLRARRRLSTASSPTSTSASPLHSIDHGLVRCQILWFGIHGGVHAKFGMLDLLQIRDALETVAKEFLVELVVVSNHPKKFDKHISPMAIPTRYIEWSPDALDLALSTAVVVVVPNSGDPFSICKSANRTVLALSRGVPVVATMTKAMESLRGCIEHEDFTNGLRRYLGDADHAASHIAVARDVIRAQFGTAVIATAWLRSLEMALACQDCRPAIKPKLLLALNLMQDVDLALPLVDQAKQMGIPVAVWVSFSLVRDVPRLVKSLRSRDVALKVWPDDLAVEGVINFPDSVQALLTLSESNLLPHRFTRRLTELANSQSIRTATCQHGFENVGLTYDDEVQSIDKVNSVAQRILLWGPLDTLHRHVPEQTKLKCLSVGCPKPAVPSPADLTGLLPPRSQVIGVFENLHWHRYDDEYRRFFLSGVQQLAESFPALTFLIKPHHAGMWLTSRFSGNAPSAPNIVIADPNSPAWEPYTAPNLLGNMSAVITTPSTVALDAARYGLPIAVVGRFLDLANYRPLPLIRDPSEWTGFVADATSLQSRPRLERLTREFLSRVLVPGNGALRILETLVTANSVPENGVTA